MKKKRKRSKARRRRNVGGGLAFLVNPGKKRRRRRRKSAPKMARRKKHRKSKARRRRRNPFGFLANPRRKRRRSRRRHHPRKRHHARRRNPGMGGIAGSVMSIVKNNAIGVAAAAAADLFVVDGLAAQYVPKEYQGPAKILAYPVIAAIAKKFLPASVGKYMEAFAVAGMAYGVKDTLARLTGAPQAALKDLADSYGYIGPAHQMGYLGPAQFNGAGFASVQSMAALANYGEDDAV